MNDTLNNDAINDDELPEEVRNQLEELHKFRRSMYNKLAPVLNKFPPEQIESKISFDKKEVVDENGNAVTECTPRLDRLAFIFSHDDDFKNQSCSDQNKSCS